MEGDDLVRIVDVMDVNLLSPQTVRLTKQVPAEPNKISVKQINAAKSLQLSPVERNDILKVSVFEELLPLEKVWFPSPDDHSVKQL